MPARALASQPDASTLPLPDKRVRVPQAIARAVTALLNGDAKTQKQAAEQAGIRPDYLCRMLATPRIQVFVARETRRHLQRGTLRAAARLVELLDSSSDHVSLDATKHTLALDGIKPASDAAQVSVNIDIKAGYVIDLSDAPRVVDVTPTRGQDVDVDGA